MALLDPDAGRTRLSYKWAYARSWHDAVPAVVCDFCRWRGAKYPLAFLDGDERRGEQQCPGTLLTDHYGAYEAVIDP